MKHKKEAPDYGASSILVKRKLLLLQLTNFHKQCVFF